MDGLVVGWECDFQWDRKNMGILRGFGIMKTSLGNGTSNLSSHVFISLVIWNAYTLMTIATFIIAGLVGSISKPSQMATIPSFRHCHRRLR